MEFITLTAENLEAEHICCAISNNRDCQVASKKAWLSDRFKEGLVFRKADARGKCFIEYLPAEKAFVPIDAENYFYIDCLWVSGSFKGQGYATELLADCIADATQKNKSGLAVLSSQKKLPFLSDPAFLHHKGFSVADSADPFFELWYLPLKADAVPPRFKEQCRHPSVKEQGFVLYYTRQCPYTAKYVPLLQETATSLGVPFRSICLETAQEAQDCPAPFTTFFLFCNGKFLTHEILSIPKFKTLVEKNVSL